ncbi:hypothetical protein QNJ25_00230 [Macrococcus caseolyticus]|nr:hypothetical protein [Macrococcus caseolyticus]MDJ1152368.1 hypothetical protein [Macrococcus caseolyticus]
MEIIINGNLVKGTIEQLRELLGIKIDKLNNYNNMKNEIGIMLCKNN